MLPMRFLKKIIIIKKSLLLPSNMKEKGEMGGRVFLVKNVYLKKIYIYLKKINSCRTEEFQSFSLSPFPI